MKRQWAVALIAMFVVAGCTASPYDSNVPQPGAAWSVPASSVPAGYRVLVVGGSNTEGTVTQQTNRNRWHDIVADRLGRQRGGSVTRVRHNGDTTGSGSTVHLDHGIAGVSAVSLVSYPEMLPPAELAVDELWMLLGSNDEIQRQSPERYASALDTLIRRYGARKCTIVAAWANGTAGFYSNRPAHEVFVDVARSAATTHRCTFVKMDDLGSSNGPLGIGDGVHLNTSGQGSLGELVSKARGV